MKRTIGGVLFLLCALCQQAQAINTNGLQAFLKQEETRLPGKIGMAIVNAEGQPIFGYRQNERFPLTSTFKVLACAALLDRLHKTSGSLDETVTIKPDELLSYSPITKNYVAPATITLQTLCAAAVSYSDNTAGNSILTYLGGPEAVTRFMRESGDTITRLDRTEPTLNEATPGDERDTSTPESMAAGVHKLLATPLLTPSHRTVLEGWMREDKVADNLLRAALPKGWTIADKTGAGGYGSRAIIAAVYPTGEKPVYMAIYITQTNAEMKVSDGVIKKIGERVFR
ncbi:class A beta-lactamase [Pseudescherichia sp.]|uniref:class A beta-lactamase n=1 Tax=Pseudescherichia sp. TaxID=2055881 RepID=UPI00289C5D1A|nr:class A beta-lactamase [Pseudescherichia sp.]